MQHDPLNDAMISLKNAEVSGKRACSLRPASKLLGNILKVMQDFEYISSFEYVENGKGGVYEVKLTGNINNCGVIKPRYAVKKTSMDKYESRYLPAQDFGVLILTTTRGVLAHSQAKTEQIGGKLLAFVY